MKMERLFINIKELVGVQQESALKTGAAMDDLGGMAAMAMATRPPVDISS